MDHCHATLTRRTRVISLVAASALAATLLAACGNGSGRDEDGSAATSEISEITVEPDASTTTTSAITTTTTPATTTTVETLTEPFSVSTPDGEVVVDPDSSPPSQFYPGGYPRLEPESFFSGGTIEGAPVGREDADTAIAVLTAVQSPQEAYQFYLDYDINPDPSHDFNIESNSSSGSGSDFVGTIVVAGYELAGDTFDAGSITTFSRGGQTLVVIVIRFGW